MLCWLLTLTLLLPPPTANWLLDTYWWLPVVWPVEVLTVDVVMREAACKWVDADEVSVRLAVAIKWPPDVVVECTLDPWLLIKLAVAYSVELVD